MFLSFSSNFFIFILKVNGGILYIYISVYLYNLFGFVMFGDKYDEFFGNKFYDVVYIFSYNAYACSMDLGIG
jgi:hypothetical protein